MTFTWNYIVPGGVEPSGSNTVWTYGTDAQLVYVSTGNFLCYFDTTGLPTCQVFYTVRTTGTGQGSTEGSFTISNPEVPFTGLPAPAPLPVPNSKPTTAEAGTLWGGSLVSFQSYQKITGDTSNSQFDVEDTIAGVVTDVSRHLNRTLVYGLYNELLFVNRLGYTFPSAIPISQVVAPFGANLQGASVWIGFYLPLPDMPVWSGVIPPQSYVEYWGGFIDSTLPPKLQRVIAKIAWYRLNPIPLIGVPAGVNSVHVGSVGFSAAGSISQFVDQDREHPQHARAFHASHLPGVAVMAIPLATTHF